MQRGYKTEIKPNNKQRTLLLKHAGAARFTYNWGLNQKKMAYENGEKTPSAIDLHRRLNALKPTELPWMYELSKCSPQEALRNLDRAFDNFFKKRGRFPRFKSKKNGIGGFRLTGTIKINNDSVQLPRLGVLKLSCFVPHPSQVHSRSAKVKLATEFRKLAPKE
jgi:putative transposase